MLSLRAKSRGRNRAEMWVSLRCYRVSPRASAIIYTSFLFSREPWCNIEITGSDFREKLIVNVLHLSNFDRVSGNVTKWVIKYYRFLISHYAHSDIRHSYTSYCKLVFLYASRLPRMRINTLHRNESRVLLRGVYRLFLRSRSTIYRLPIISEKNNATNGCNIGKLVGSLSLSICTAFATGKKQIALRVTIWLPGYNKIVLQCCSKTKRLGTIELISCMLRERGRERERSYSVKYEYKNNSRESIHTR